jgi:hypothetical protein
MFESVSWALSSRCLVFSPLHISSTLQWRTQGGMHRMHVHPPSPPLCITPRPCASPPPQPERLVMRKDETVGNKKKMQVCLPAT